MLALFAGANLSLLAAATPAVGIVTARGAFLLDNASVSGNATLFEGDRIETGASSSQLQLNNGARVQLGAESSGVVYRDRLVLERGNGRFENYSVEALSLRIQPESGGATAEVSVRKASLAGPGVVLVAALNGPVKVTNANGVVLANVKAGARLNFTPETSAPAAVTPATNVSVSGCLEERSGRFYLTDETTMVRFGVTGGGLAAEVGRRVRVDGSIGSAVESVSRVETSRVTRLSNKCTPLAKVTSYNGAGADGQDDPGANGKSGSSGSGSSGASAPVATGTSVATKAVIVGVVVAGAATGTAIAIVKHSDDGPAAISPSTR